MVFREFSRSARTSIIFFAAFLTVSCLKSDDVPPGPGPDPDPDPDPDPVVSYIYPFSGEARNVVAEITFQTDGTVDLGAVTASVPALKYNKSWLLMLTQDDCKQAAYCCTWAAINGKPLSAQYYYNASQLAAGDLPPDASSLGKTLGSTDGAGNEVRFSFATTLAPEWSWMNDKAVVDRGNTSNYYRFFMRNGLMWENVVEMCNYGVGIAFHDVNSTDVNSAPTILQHYGAVQTLILDKLSGRGCKFLAEPNGNKTYVVAAQSYAPIQTMTAQAGGSGFSADPLYPFLVSGDLGKVLLHRAFHDNPETVKSAIQGQLSLAKENRKAILVGVHGTDSAWAQFLLWLNNTYGKDGDDSVWVPSQEEYYEYNYYRTHGTVQKIVDGNALKITVSMPSGEYFYYPSLTVNLKGLQKSKITSVASSTSVTGLSYGDYADALALNLDCRKALVSHATHFVERYEAGKSASGKSDALYFVNMLKASDTKQALLQRIK